MEFGNPRLNPDRFEPVPGRVSMKAVVTQGTGGYEQLESREVPLPLPGPGEVLVQVLAAGVNNTDINTRLGWYAAHVTQGTDALAGEDAPAGSEPVSRGGWKGTTPFPLIQGTDCCGRVVGADPDREAHLLGKRVLVRPCIRHRGWDSLDHIWMASDMDGAFAQFVAVPASEVFPVDCDWSDAQLGSIPCAHGTAENMLNQAGVRAGHHVLISGASGGVGSAAVQLARRRGARVTAVTSVEKAEGVTALGAHRVLSREDHVLEVLGPDAVDVVVDNVAGPGLGERLKLLRRGGCFVTSGAVAEPMVELDLRDLYLKDLRILGCTAWDEAVFPHLISYIETGQITPPPVKTFDLSQIQAAQEAFLNREHVGKLVLIPPEFAAPLPPLPGRPSLPPHRRIPEGKFRVTPFKGSPFLPTPLPHFPHDPGSRKERCR